MDPHRFDGMLRRSAHSRLQTRNTPIAEDLSTHLIRDLFINNNKKLQARDDCSVLTDPNCNKSVSSASYSLPIALAVM